MDEPNVDWEKVERLAKESFEKKQERPGDEYFTVKEFSQRKNMSLSQSSQILRKMVQVGSLERTKANGKYYYRMTD